MNLIECKLGDLGKIVGGSTPSTKDSENYGGNIPWITPKDLTNLKGRYVEKGERNITEKGYRSTSTKMLPPNSILFSSRAPIGYIAINKKEVCTNQGFKSIIPNSKVNYMFLYYLLKYNKNKVESLGIGTTFKEISGSVMKEIKVDIPETLEEQIKIAIILSKLDEKIELNNNINNNLYEIQRCYFQKLFKYNNEYEIIKLSDICEISAGGDAPKDRSQIKNEIYAIPIISNGIDNEGIYGYAKEAKITKKSITISARGTIGHKVLRNYDYYPIVRLISIFPKTNRVSSEYLFYILDDVEIIGTGTTQQQLTIPMVKDIKIKLFNKKLIEKFTLFSENMNNAIERNKRENEILEQVRDELLPKLMNGEVDIDKIEI